MFEDSLATDQFGRRRACAGRERVFDGVHEVFGEFLFISNHFYAFMARSHHILVEIAGKPIQSSLPVSRLSSATPTITEWSASIKPRTKSVMVSVVSVLDPIQPPRTIPMNCVLLKWRSTLPYPLCVYYARPRMKGKVKVKCPPVHIHHWQKVWPQKLDAVMKDAYRPAGLHPQNRRGLYQSQFRSETSSWQMRFHSKYLSQSAVSEPTRLAKGGYKTAETSAATAMSLDSVLNRNSFQPEVKARFKPLFLLP